MSLDNETRNYVDEKFEKSLEISKDEIKECPTGKILREKIKHNDRRINEMNGDIKHLADTTTDAVNAIKNAAANAKLENEKEKGNKKWSMILLLANFIIILIVAIVTLKH